MKHLLLLLSSLYFNQFVFSQELKTFKGSFDNFQDEFLGVRLSAENGAQAEFTFFLDANEQMVKQGEFLAEQSKVFTVSNQSFGYSGSASGRQYGRVTGSYKNNIKVGLWKYQKVQFGMNLSGAQFDFRKLEWNSLSINNSKEIESIRTVSVNYDNGIPEGEMKDEVFEKGKKIIDIKCSVHNGHFVGAFTGTSKDTYGTSRNGMFDQNGFYDGEWVDEDLHEGTITKWNFVHGVLIAYVSHNISTGVKVKEYKNPIASYVANNELPKGITIDTFEYTYPEKSIRFTNSGLTGKNAHENPKLPASQLYSINYTPPPEISLGRDLYYNSTGAGSFLDKSLDKRPRRLMFVNRNWNNYDSSFVAFFSENSAEILKYGNSIFEEGYKYKDLLFTLLRQKGLYTILESLFNNALNILAEGLYKGSEKIEYINDFNSYYNQVNSTIEDIKPYTGIRKVINAYDKFQNDYLKKQKSNPEFAFLLNIFLDTSLANIKTESSNSTDVTIYLIKLDSLIVVYNFPETTPEENVVLYFNNNRWDKLREIFKGEEWKLIKDQVGEEIVKFTWYKYNKDEINYDKVNNDNPITNYYIGEHIYGNILHYIKFLDGAKNYTLSKSGSIDSTTKYIEIKFKSKDSIDYNLYALFKRNENLGPYGELIKLTLMTDEDRTNEEIFGGPLSVLFINSKDGKYHALKLNISKIKSDFVLFYVMKPIQRTERNYTKEYYTEGIEKDRNKTEQILKSLKSKYNDDKLILISVSNDDVIGFENSDYFNKKVCYRLASLQDATTNSFYGHLTRNLNKDIYFDSFLNKIGCFSLDNSDNNFILLDLINKKVYNKITIQELSTILTK